MNIDKINEWLEKHDYDCQAIEGDQFQYLTLDDGDGEGIETIIVAKENPHDSDLRVVCERFGVTLDNTNLRVFCFLHELGHYNTAEYYSLWSYLAHAIIMYLIPNIPMFDKLTEYIHHRFNYELGATEWACEYMLEHPRTVKQLSKIL